MTITAKDSADTPETLDSDETTNDTSITLTFTSNETTTNFASDDVTVTGGTLNDTDGATTFDGSGTTYTATFTPTGDATCTIAVSAGAFTDAAGNDNAVSNTFTWTYDSTAPTYSSSSVGPKTTVIVDSVDVSRKTFDNGPIAANTDINKADFNVKVDRGDETIYAATAPEAAAVITDGKVRLTLANDVLFGQTVSISYTKHGDADTVEARNIADAAGNAVATFGTTTRKVVTNNVDDTVIPTIESNATATAIIENSGANQAVYTIQALANDGGSIQSYAIANTTATDDQGVVYPPVLAVTDADDNITTAAVMSVDTSTGIVTLIPDPDSETRGFYKFDVTATDETHTSNATTVTLEITSIDDTAPTVTSDASVTLAHDNKYQNDVVYLSLIHI